MTRGDRILVAVVACVALLSAPLVSAASSGASVSAVVRAPAGRTVLDLTRDGRYEIQGRRGVVVLDVTSGEIAAVEADCPDGICVRTGTARPGRPIVCAPNGVSVAVSGGGEGALDAVSR